MRKQFLILFLVLITASTFQAQTTRGTKIGYIDMEYILQNVPDYTEAQNQLEQKAQKWKQEIESKKNEINKLKEALNAEKALLTKGLIEERTTEIAFLENELLEYQQKRFGPYGDLMTQKSGLTKPIQDQVFTAVQDIAEAKKYDFIFDKTSDLTMLFAAKRFDISDQIIRVLKRVEKREQLSKKQLEAEDAKELKQDAIDENPDLSARQKVLDEKKLAREKLIADKLLLQEERKNEAEAKRAQLVADREAKKTGTSTSSTASKSSSTSDENELKAEERKTAIADAKQKQADERAKILEDRKKAVEDRVKAAEERRLQILADREAKKAAISKATDEVPNNAEKKVATKTGTVSESTNKEETSTTTETEEVKVDAKTAAAEARQQQLDARAKILEDRKKALEEKKQKAIQDREDALKAREEQLKNN